MTYTKFTEEVNVSRLGMGAMRLPTNGEGWTAPIDEARATEIIDYCMENGVNFYDSALIYHGGKSEVFLGNALKKYPRESFYVSTKYRLFHQMNHKEQLEEQLKRLQMDYIDFYMIHGIQDEGVEETLSNGCIEYFNEMKAQGKIKNVGFSVHCSPDSMRRLIAANKWDFVMLQLNYFDWEYGGEKELYDIAVEANIPIIGMEPLRGGLLATLTDESAIVLKESAPERSLASWSMRWLLDLPQVKVVLSGMSNMDVTRDNVSTFAEGKQLDENEKKTLAKARDIYRPAVSVACTACRYCVADCPQELDIPRLLHIYNEVKLGGGWRASFQESLPEGKRATDCTACGVCSPLCPQGFDIPSFIKGLTETSRPAPPPKKAD